MAHAILFIPPGQSFCSILVVVSGLYSAFRHLFLGFPNSRIGGIICLRHGQQFSASCREAWRGNPRDTTPAPPARRDERRESGAPTPLHPQPTLTHSRRPSYRLSFCCSFFFAVSSSPSSSSSPTASPSSPTPTRAAPALSPRSCTGAAPSTP